MPMLKYPRTCYLGNITGLAIYVVDGEHVRNEIDLDFTQGGNNAVYPNYVPRGEIWIDDVLGTLDRTATLLHEIVELNLMTSKGWGYDRAHDAASAAERPFRRELMKNPPRTTDLARVSMALLKQPSTAAVAKHDREYPRVAAVGKRRKSAKLAREVNAFIQRRR